MDTDDLSHEPGDVSGGTVLAVALAVGIALGVALGMRMNASANRMERRLGEYAEGFSLMRSGGR